MCTKNMFVCGVLVLAGSLIFILVTAANGFGIIERAHL